jgi:anti-sigma-K factor RskA
MSEHGQFAEDLSLYALGALEGEERTALEEHLDGCASCRRELEKLRGDMALMALSAAGPAPPMRARSRLMTAVSLDTRATPIVVKKRSWWGAYGWVAAAAMTVVAIFFWKQTDQMAQRMASLHNEFSAQQAELERVKSVVTTLTAPDAQVVTVAAPNAPPQPQGKAIYVRDRSSLVFIVSNMPAPPAQKAYELWLIPQEGAPIPAGVFKPNAHGSATVVNPPLPAGVEAKAFAITVEPEAGSLTPTLPIVMLGSGS